MPFLIYKFIFSLYMLKYTHTDLATLRARSEYLPAWTLRIYANIGFVVALPTRVQCDVRCKHNNASIPPAEMRSNHRTDRRTSAHKLQPESAHLWRRSAQLHLRMGGRGASRTERKRMCVWPGDWRGIYAHFFGPFRTGASGEKLG